MISSFAEETYSRCRKSPNILLHVTALSYMLPTVYDLRCLQISHKILAAKNNNQNKM